MSGDEVSVSLDAMSFVKTSVTAPSASVSPLVSGVTRVLCKEKV